MAETMTPQQQSEKDKAHADSVKALFAQLQEGVSDWVRLEAELKDAKAYAKSLAGKLVNERGVKVTGDVPVSFYADCVINGASKKDIFGRIIVAKPV